MMNVKQEGLDIREDVLNNKLDPISGQIKQQKYKEEDDGVFEELETNTPGQNVKIKEEIIEYEELKIEQALDLLPKINSDSTPEKKVRFCYTTIKKELENVSEVKTMDIKEEREYIQSKVELLHTHCDLETMKNESSTELCDSEENERIPNMLKNDANVIDIKKKRKQYRCQKNINGHFRQGSVAYKLNEKLVKEIDSKIHTNEKTFECNICSKKFKRKQILLNHLINHTNEKPFKCEICSKGFSNQHLLRRHLIIHTNEKPFKCDICSKGFNDKSILRKHLKIHTNEKPFECNTCYKKFSQKVYLQNHLRIHYNEGSFKCDICSKKFNHKCTLQDHLRTHSKEKTFKCDICSKRFNFKRNLQEHLRIHTNEKPFKCNICFKELSKEITLRNHLRIHTNEKPFQCNICSKKFNYKRFLQTHLRTHSNEKIFKCDICFKGFNDKSYLQKHLKIHTNKI